MKGDKMKKMLSICFLTIFISSCAVLAENSPIPNLMPLVKKVLKSDAGKKIVKKVIKEEVKEKVKEEVKEEVKEVKEDVVKAAILKTVEVIEENNVADEESNADNEESQ
tara:strand:+ start:71 stop:397 length:327 start_codon:yes stop_codon:yes gene_type:complete